MVSREVQERWSQMLQDSNPDVQLQALTEIGWFYFHPEGAYDRLVGDLERQAQELGLPVEVVDITTEQKMGVGRGAMHAKGIPEARPPIMLRDAILKILKSGAPTIRAEAVLTLVHWRDKKAIDSLLDKLVDPDRTVRLAAVQALAEMGEAKCIPALLAVAQNDREELVRAHALLAIKRISKDAVRGFGKKSPISTVRTQEDMAVPRPAVVLEQIMQSDASRYVVFLAQKVRQYFED